MNIVIRADFRMLSLAANYNWGLILDQHERILMAIKDRNSVLAEKVMEEHLKKLTFEQDTLKNEYISYFR
ncbi:FCD domain-containing protein [Salipaludibacillus neizhouensis]